MANHRAAGERPNPNPGYRGQHTGPQTRPQGVDPMRPYNPVAPQGYAEEMAQPFPPVQHMHAHRPPMPDLQRPQRMPQFEGPTHQQPPTPPQGEHAPAHHAQPRKGTNLPSYIAVAVISAAIGYAVHNQPDPKALPTAAAVTHEASQKPTQETRIVNLPEVSPTPKVRYVKMPNLVGKNASIAKDALVDLGFDPYEDIELGSQDTFDTVVLLPANWRVTAQSHPAGTRIKVGDKVVLTCSKNQ